MLNTHLTQLEIIGNTKVLRELFKAMRLVGAFHVFSRQKMVRNQHNTFLVEDFFLAQITESLYGYRTSNVVTQANIDFCGNKVAGGYAFRPGNMGK